MPDDMNHKSCDSLDIKTDNKIYDGQVCELNRE